MPDAIPSALGRHPAYWRVVDDVTAEL